MPEVWGEAMREPEGRSACGVQIQRGRVIQRQDILIAPHVHGTIGDAAQDLALEGFVVIVRFEPLRLALFADRWFEWNVGLLFAADGALQVGGCGHD